MIDRVGVAIVAALVTGMAWPAAGQDLRWTLGSPTAGLPGDADGSLQYDVDDAPGVELREIAEADLDLPRLRTLSTAALDGFDGRFAVTGIEAYFDREQGPEEDRILLASSATLRLIVRTRASDGAVRWFRLAGESDRLAILDEPVAPPPAPQRWFDEDRRDRLVLATADGKLPIVDVQYSSTMLHASSGSSTRHHLLLDFRAPTPRVIGVFDEMEGGCGGACSVYLCIYGIDREVGCRWDPMHDAFLCATTVRRSDTAWIERRATGYFRFGSSAPIDPPTSTSTWGLDPSTPRDLIPRERSAKFVKGYGTVSAIANVGVAKKAVSLVGAPSMSWHFGARLFAAVTDHGYRGPLTEIGSRLDVRSPQSAEGDSTVARLEDEDSLSVSELEALTPDGAPPRFVVTELARSASVTIVRLLVAEGDAKGVYLVGLELVGDRLVTDAMLVATNGESHLHCNTWRVPATAVGMTVVAKPFAVTLDIEPARVRDDGPNAGEDNSLDPPAAPPCRVRATVDWEAGQGFRYASRDKRCGSAPPRPVAIDDWGAISVAPPVPEPPL